YPAGNASAPPKAAPITQPPPLPAAGGNGTDVPFFAPPGAGSPATPSSPPAQDGGTPSPQGLNDYLMYLRPAACCGPIGRDGPINTEVFFRPGMSFPIGGSILGRALDPGFMMQGGGRVLFFTPSQRSAWTVELGVTTAWYDAGRDIGAPLLNVQRP